MANEKNIVLHKRSVVVEEGQPKLPTSAQTEYGEININYADGYETLSIRNNADEIVTFSSDEKIKGLIPNVISTFEDYMQVSASTGDVVDAYILRTVIKDNELVTSQSLNDLNTRINDISSTFPSAITINNKTTYSKNNAINLGSGFVKNSDIAGIVTAITMNNTNFPSSSKKINLGNVVTDIIINESAATINDGIVNLGNYMPISKEFAISSAFNDLNDRVIHLESVISNMQSTITSLQMQLDLLNT